MTRSDTKQHLEDHPLRERGIVSRRAFFCGAAAMAAQGFFAMLPRVDEGYLAPVVNAVAPKVALAKEGDAYFTITVVGKDQVGFHVLDVSTMDDDGNCDPVHHAKVTIRSRFNDKTVSGETDKEGKVILSIADLAMVDENGRLVNDRYQCNAEITVDPSKTRPKMRNFSMGLVHLEGASGVVVGSHRLKKDDDIYIERMAFDEWDCLYTKPKFFRSKENDITHSVHVRFKGATGPLPVKFAAVWLDEDGDVQRYEDSSTGVYNPDTGFTTVDFNGKFLMVDKDKDGKEQNDECFDGDEVKLVIYYQADGVNYEVTTKIETELAPIEGVEYSSPLSPFLTGNGDLFSVSGGNDWPCFNGYDISICNFNFPVHVNFTPENIMLSFGDDFKILDDKGKVSPNEWKDQITASPRERYEKAKEDYMKDLAQSERAAPFKDKNGNETTKNFANKFSIKIIAQVCLGLQWDGFKGEGTKVTKTFAGQLGIGLGIGVKGSFTWEFMAGPVPCFFSITPSLEVMGAFTFQATHEMVKEDTELAIADLKWVPEAAFMLNMKLGLKLALGVGVDGVVAASVSGAASLPMRVGWGDEKPAALPQAPDTHFTVGVTFKAEVNLQLLCFSCSINIWSISKNPFYDNWKDHPYLVSAAAESVWGDYSSARFLHTVGGRKRHSMTLALGPDGHPLPTNDGGFLDNLTPVTMQDMGETYEAYAVTKVAPPANAAPADLPSIQRGMIPQLVELEDGSLVTRLVECAGANSFVYEDEYALPQEEGKKTAQRDAADQQQEAAQQDEAASEQQGEAVDAAAQQAEASQTDVEAGGAEAATDQGAGEGQAAGDAPTQDVSSSTETVEAAASDASASLDAATGESVDAADATVAADAAEAASGDAPLQDVAAEGATMLAATAAAAASGTKADAGEAATAAADASAAAEATAEATAAEQQEDASPAAVEAKKTASRDAADDTLLLGDQYLGFGEEPAGEYDYAAVDGKTTGAICRKKEVLQIT